MRKFQTKSYLSHGKDLATRVWKNHASQRRLKG